MKFKNFPTPHCHSSSSLDSASTPAAFAKRECELETGTLTVTDHGTMAGARNIYEVAHNPKRKGGKLTPILGLEAYVRDDECPILIAHEIPKDIRYRNLKTGALINEEKYLLKTEKNRADFSGPHIGGFHDYKKYYHVTIHFQDQAAFEAGSRLLSVADARAEKHGSERKPLFAWAELEELGGYNVTMTSGCLIGMVQRHIAFGGRFDIAQKYYERLRSLVKPGNFYVEVFPHVCDRNWDSAVILKFEDGTSERVKSSKILRTDKGKYGDRAEGGGVYADALVKAWEKDPKGHGALRAVMENKKFVEREPKILTDVSLHEGYQMNECTEASPNGDLQVGCNRFVMELAKRYGDKILISDDSHFTKPEEKIVQDIKLASSNWRFANSYHRMSSAEAWEYFDKVMGIPMAEFESWIDNNREWAAKFEGFKFEDRRALPTKFYPINTGEHILTLIKKHGRMDWKNKEYVARLTAEMNLLHYNGVIDLLPYFMIDEECCALHEQNGLLTGPGRGSAAGLLLTYLLGITHVDPIRYDLSMDRFLTLDRIKSGKLPDIDQDLPHRDLIISTDDEHPENGWLHRRFGDHVAQISVDTKLKLRSAVKDVARMTSPNKKVPKAVEALAKKFQNAPQGIEDHDFVFGYEDADKNMVAGSIESDLALQEYVANHPKDWEIVQLCLGITRQKSRHPCGYVICNEPVHNFIPLTSVGGVTVTQYTPASVEAAGGIKMDFLTVSSLNDIWAAIRLIQDRSTDTSVDWQQARAPTTGTVPSKTINNRRVPMLRIIPHKGEYLDIWDLPEDQDVFSSICAGDTESVFQFNTESARKWLSHFNHVKCTDANGVVHKALDSILALADFTALDRPGPLDAYVKDPKTNQYHNMLIEYAHRARGVARAVILPVLDELIPETHGVLTYQEQLTRIFQQLGGTTGAEADEFRVHISKKQTAKVFKDKEIFMPGAIARMGEKDAQTLWEMMETFSNYGFNKSHAVCYVVIGYACAWLKYHYPLEWWTAVLRNASKNDIDTKFWRHCGHLIDLPDINLSGDQFEIVNERIRAPTSLLKGIGPKAHAELCTYRPCKDAEDLVRKIEAYKASTKPKTRSALTSATIETLIIGGAANSLFPDSPEAKWQLEAWETAVSEVTGKRKKSVDAKFQDLKPLMTYQYRKKLLPAYSENLIPLAALKEIPNLAYVRDSRFDDLVLRYRYVAKGEDEVDDNVFALRADELLRVEAEPLVPGGLRCAAVAYICDQKWRNYQETKEMTVLSIDVEGLRRELVIWPNSKGKLAAKFKESYKGAICLVVLAKWKSDKPLSIEDLIVIQPPLTEKPEEVSPEPVPVPEAVAEPNPEAQEEEVKDE